jgi:hypothetical protein
MEIHIHIEKKHIYMLIAILIVVFSTIFVFASHGDGTLLPNPVTGIHHFLQDIVRSDSLDSVDSDNNGFIDSSDNCEGDDVCEVNSIKLIPRASAPASPANTIWYQN